MRISFDDAANQDYIQEQENAFGQEFNANISKEFEQGGQTPAGSVLGAEEVQ
jgi:hypothetical protein